MKQFSIQEMVKIALFTSLIAALGFVSIPLPFSPVPITGQTLGIILAGLLLTPQGAGSAVALWAFMGTIGLPVFSGGRAGYQVLMGPSGGYILGFLACAVFIAFLRGKQPNLVRYALVSAIGSTVIIYAFGVLGLMLIVKLPLAAAFANGVLPFLIGDTLKLIIAVATALQLKRSAPQLFVN